MVLNGVSTLLFAALTTRNGVLERDVRETSARSWVRFKAGVTRSRRRREEEEKEEDTDGENAGRNKKQAPNVREVTMEEEGDTDTSNESGDDMDIEPPESSDDETKQVAYDEITQIRGERAGGDAPDPSRRVSRKACPSLESALALPVETLTRIWKNVGGTFPPGNQTSWREGYPISSKISFFRRVLENLDRDGLSGPDRERARKFCDECTRIANQRFVDWMGSWPDPFRMGAIEFQREVTTRFRRYLPPTLPVFSDACSRNKVIKFTQYQEFVRHYLTPANPLKGLLLWHSVGAGKTCTMISAASSTFEKQGWHILLSAPGNIDSEFLKNVFDDVCHDSMRAQIGENDNNSWSKIAADERANTFMEQVPKCSWITSDKSGSGVSKGPGHLLSWDHNRLYNYVVDESHSAADARRVRQCIGKASKDDHLYRCLIIIDEAHSFIERNFVDSTTKAFNERKYARFLHFVRESHRKSGKNSVKFLLASATPQMSVPVNLFRLLNIIINPGGGGHGGGGVTDLPVSDAAYARWVQSLPTSLGEVTASTHAVVSQFFKTVSGLISYIDVTRDISRFPHVTTEAHIRVAWSDNQVESANACLKKRLGRGVRGRSASSGLGACLQRMTNFAERNERYVFDSPSFEPDILRDADNLALLAPKVVSLLDRIDEHDARDFRAHASSSSTRGRLRKHVIYTKSTDDARMLLSCLIADGYHHILERVGSGRDDGDGATNGVTSGVRVRHATDTKTRNYQVAILSRAAKFWGSGGGEGKLSKTINKIFNGADNVHGEKLRFLIIDESVSHGIDLYDVAHFYILEPTSTDLFWKSVDPTLRDIAYEDVVSQQIIGRATRFCGSKRLPFVTTRHAMIGGREVPIGWSLTIDRFTDVIPVSERAKFKGAKTPQEILIREGEANLSQLKQLASQQKVKNLAIMCSIDRDINAAWTNAKSDTKRPVYVQWPLRAEDVKDLVSAPKDSADEVFY